MSRSEDRRVQVLINDKAEKPHVRPRILVCIVSDKPAGFCDISWAATMMQVQMPSSAVVDYEVCGPGLAVDRARSGNYDYMLAVEPGVPICWDAVSRLLANGARGGDGPAYWWSASGGKFDFVGEECLSTLDVAIPETDPARDDALIGRINHPPNQSLIHAIPTLGRVPIQWLVRTLGLRLPNAMFSYLAIMRGYEVAEARERLVGAAIRSGARWLFFHGDDMLPEPGQLCELWHSMRTNQLPALSALYNHRGIERPTPIMYRIGSPGCMLSGTDFEPGEMVEVDTCGLDFCLLDLHQVAKMPAPRFKTFMGRDAHGDATYHTEDDYFWRSFKRTSGRRPIVDTGIQVGHLDIASGKVY